MNTQTKNLHTGYRHNCTEIVERPVGKNSTIRTRVRSAKAPSFKDWVRDQPEGAAFFDRKRRAR